MKKFLIIVILSIMIVGCEKNEDTENNLYYVDNSEIIYKFFYNENIEKYHVFNFISDKKIEINSYKLILRKNGIEDVENIDINYDNYNETKLIDSYLYEIYFNVYDESLISEYYFIKITVHTSIGTYEYEINEKLIKNYNFDLGIMGSKKIRFASYTNLEIGDFYNHNYSFNISEKEIDDDKGISINSIKLLEDRDNEFPLKNITINNAELSYSNKYYSSDETLSFSFETERFVCHGRTYITEIKHGDELSSFLYYERILYHISTLNELKYAGCLTRIGGN